MKFKSMLILLLSFLALPIQGMERESESSQAKRIAINAYLTSLGATTVHEIGHVLAGKKLFNCRALFFITPLMNGGTIFYKGPLLKFLIAIKENRGSYFEKAHVSLMNKMESKRGIPMLLAGPFAGMAYAGILPFLNTAFAEYKHQRDLDKKYGNETSMKNVLCKALEQPYLNSNQDGGVILGCFYSFCTDVYNLLPSFKGCDGDRILDCLKINMNRSLIRYSIKGIPCLSLAAYAFLKDKF